MKNVLLILLSIMIYGCSSKRDTFHNLEKNELLGFTQKFEFIENNENRFVIIGTYVNPILFKNEFSATSENFLLILYPESLSFDENSVAVNGDNKDIKIEQIYEGDELLEKLAISVPWGNYFLITSPAQKNSKTVTLSFLTTSGQSVKLSFAKVSASMYWSPSR